MREPELVTEFEVQAWLWAELRAIGLPVRGEITKHDDAGDRRKKSRFDLARFENGQLVGVIEVKARPIKHKTDAGWGGTRQGRKYERLGVPVELVCGIEQAQEFVDRVRKTGRLFS